VPLTPAGRRACRPRATAASLLAFAILGLLLMQASWIISVPAFRAIDEFDHAHRAASVANGHWGPARQAAPQGRGRLVTSTAALVDAAEERCEFYAYTRPDNCHPVEQLGDGNVLIASAATEQPSGYYAVIGYPAAVTDGAAALFVMRAVGALLCALMVGLSLWAIHCWAEGPIPMFALTLSLTPIAIYSTVVPSGNGLELVSAVALWCALLGLGTPRGGRHERALLLAATAPMVLLCGLRQLGPGMAGMIVTVTLVLLGVRRAWGVVQRHPWVTGWLVLAATLSTASQASWVLAAGRFPVGPTDPTMLPSTATPSPFGVYLVQWFLGSFGAFPTRNEPAPVLVYAVLVLASLVFVLWGLLRSSGRTRVALCLTMALSVVVPIIFTLVYWDPAKWQGRYSLPLTVGCFLLVGRALHTVRPRVTPVLLAVALVGAMHVVSIVGLSRFTNVPVMVVLPAALMILGWLVVIRTLGAYTMPQQTALSHGEIEQL
jgi:hypothetical protein